MLLIVKSSHVLVVAPLKRSKHVKRACLHVYDGKDIWLTAFTDVMKILINKVDLSCNNTTDELKQGLLNLENVELLIDSTSNFILDVLK